MSGLASDAGATAAGYVIGSIPFGLLLGRATRGLDVRETGSGSMGSTNVLRVAGPAAAGATFALDVGKGTAAVLCARALGAGAAGQVGAGLAAMVGHSWPVFAGFRGGKSVATAFGACWRSLRRSPAYAVAGGVSALVSTRIVSLGSLVAAGAATLGAGSRPLRGGPRGPLVFAGLASRPDRGAPHRQPAPAGARARAAGQPAADAVADGASSPFCDGARGGRRERPRIISPCAGLARIAESPARFDGCWPPRPSPRWPRPSL